MLLSDPLKFFFASLFKHMQCTPADLHQLLCAIALSLVSILSLFPCFRKREIYTLFLSDPLNGFSPYVF